MNVGGVFERLRALLGGDGDLTDITRDPGPVDRDRAIDREQASEAVDAARESTQADALAGTTDSPGPADGD